MQKRHRLIPYLGIVTLTASLGAILAPSAASAQCKAPRVLVVLDKSSSMLGTVGTETKWDIAKGALSQVVQTYQTSADFGLMIFPSPSQCGPGTVKVPIGPVTAASILAELTTPPPVAGNWTPMAQSLDAAPNAAGLKDAAYPRHVLLITDGWQWCDPHDTANRFLPVNSVTALKQLGITTHVVGFGDGVDSLTLNKMAAAADTKISPTCDPTASKPEDTNHCYYQASNPQALLAALQAIAKKITQEVCDGLDNDCNGTVDDGVTGPLCDNQKGVCAGATKTCGGTAGWVGSCDGTNYGAAATANGQTYEADEKLCDGLDNDCDGVIDEGCDCQQGQTRACGVNVGACSPGTQRCVNGKWGGCEGEIKASAEVCDSIDNNCDGKVDENLTRECKSACGVGIETCLGGGFANCTAPQPTAEICDGMDNDCDGVVDGPNATCENGGTCIEGICQEPVSADTGAGCDCRVGDGASTALPLFWLIALGLLVVRRRRRR